VLFSGVQEVMYFVPDPEAAGDWYARLFGIEKTRFYNPDFFVLRVGGVDVFFHPADTKGPSGVAGQVVYWRVEDFDAAVRHAESLGATLYRGPLDRTDGTFMCQMKDPFGNAFGMIGQLH
jgi:uncharacterized protein